MKSKHCRGGSKCYKFKQFYSALLFLLRVLVKIILVVLYLWLKAAKSNVI